MSEKTSVSQLLEELKGMRIAPELCSGHWDTQYLGQELSALLLAACSHKVVVMGKPYAPLQWPLQLIVETLQAFPTSMEPREFLEWRAAMLTLSQLQTIVVGALRYVAEGAAEGAADAACKAVIPVLQQYCTSSASAPMPPARLEMFLVLLKTVMVEDRTFDLAFGLWFRTHRFAKEQRHWEPLTVHNPAFREYRRKLDGKPRKRRDDLIVNLKPGSVAHRIDQLVKCLEVYQEQGADGLVQLLDNDLLKGVLQELKIGDTQRKPEALPMPPQSLQDVHGQAGFWNHVLAARIAAGRKIVYPFQMVSCEHVEPAMERSVPGVNTAKKIKEACDSSVGAMVQAHLSKITARHAARLQNQELQLEALKQQLEARLAGGGGVAPGKRSAPDAGARKKRGRPDPEAAAGPDEDVKEPDADQAA